jgi:hypothetical protein
MEYKINAEPLLEGLMESLNNTGKEFKRIVGDIINQDPYCGHDFFIYIIFQKKSPDMLTHKLLYQHTLMKPYPMEGTTLLRVDIKKKDYKIIWTLPLEEFMEGFYKGMFSNDFVNQCIKDYKSGKLNPRPEEDPKDEEIKEIIKAVGEKGKLK